eukprot:COSAG01_NODE_70492_length_258_cov_0.962264_1_plen_20_part_01
MHAHPDMPAYRYVRTQTRDH